MRSVFIVVLAVLLAVGCGHATNPEQRHAGYVPAVGDRAGDVIERLGGSYQIVAHGPYWYDLIYSEHQIAVTFDQSDQVLMTRPLSVIGKREAGEGDGRN